MAVLHIWNPYRKSVLEDTIEKETKETRKFISYSGHRWTLRASELMPFSYQYNNIRHGEENAQGFV